jgi:hypothetical protein
MISNDNNSDESLTILKPYIDKGVVEFLHRPGAPFVSLQTDIYLEVILLARNKTRWIAFLDTDEFILPIEHDSICDVLKDYEMFAGIAVNWACFGSSGLVSAPDLQTESFSMRLPDCHDENRAFKSIVNPNYVIGVSSPHKLMLHENYNIVDEFKNIVINHEWKNLNNPFFGKKIRINHYRIRSRSEFDQKVSRWKNNYHPEFGSQNEIEAYWSLIDNDNVSDNAIQRFVPALKARLKVKSGFSRVKNTIFRLVKKF